LAYSNDKLIALSGAIRKIEIEAQDTCFAGILHNNIEKNKSRVETLGEL